MVNNICSREFSKKGGFTVRWECSLNIVKIQARMYRLYKPNTTGEFYFYEKLLRLQKNEQAAVIHQSCINA